MLNKQNSLILAFHTFVERFILQTLSPFIVFIKNTVNILFITTTPENLLCLIFSFKNNSIFKFKQLSDIITTDSPKKFHRFNVRYLLTSLKFNQKICIQINTPENLGIPTIDELFLSGNWLEREVWDMFGIAFRGNKDLRRVLTDYGFIGHPLRKDFPLTGFYEIYYNEVSNNIEIQHCVLGQSYRNFLNVSG